MRIVLALLLVLPLAACGATSDAPPGPAGDAGRDAPETAPADTGFRCVLGREQLVNGRCVSATPADCNGRACAAGQICDVRLAIVDGGERYDFVCAAP